MQRRNRERKRLSAVEAEIFLLEKEKKMASNAMIEIESEEEIKKRARSIKVTAEKCLPEPTPKITQSTLDLLNKMLFEMCNLPLEYLLSQSNKMVLTSEWLLSMIERQWVNRLLQIKKSLSNKTLLEEKNPSIFTEAEKKRREILRQSLLDRSKAFKIAAAIRGEKERESLLDRICREHSPEVHVENIHEKYSALLSLFSLMKSSKSSMRASIPSSKKSASSMHSSHAACIEKIRAEIGRISTIAEIARYRQCQKQQEARPEEQRQSVNLHRSSKHGLPIIYTDFPHNPAPLDDYRGAQGEK